MLVSTHYPIHHQCFLRIFILLNEMDVRKTWYIINSVLRPTPLLPSVSSMLIFDIKTVQGDADVQLELTSYFANLGKATASSATSRCDFRAYLGPSYLKSMVLNSVSEFDVARIVNALIGSSSSGPDKIPIRVIHAILPAILSPLTKLVNLSFEKGIFPESLKRAKVIVLYKGGSRSDPANYRPISLLSVFSKILRRLYYPGFLFFWMQKNFRMIFSLDSERVTLRSRLAQISRISFIRQ